MIETLIYNTLLASTAITRIVGTRIYALEVPEDTTLPALSYRIVSAVSSPTFATSGMTKYRVQIDCWADGKTQGYSQAVALRDAVISSLNGYIDAYMSSFSASISDQFEHELLQYVCSCDFYILSTL